MGKFKNGDKVKCVEADGTPFTNGEVLTVKFTTIDGGPALCALVRNFWWLV